MSARLAYALTAVLLMGCSGTRANAPPPTPAPGPAPPGHQAETPPPRPPEAAPPADAPIEVNLQMPIRPGWAQVPRSMLGEDGPAGLVVSPPNRAMLMLFFEAPAAMSPNEAATHLAGQFGGDGWTVSSVTAWPDANGATFTMSKGEDRGKITVRRLRDSPAVNVLFMGRWTTTNAAAMAADYDAMVSGASLR